MHLFRSIRGKLILSYVLLTLLTALLVGFLSYYLVRLYVDRRETEYYEATAASLASRLAPPIFKENYGEAEEMIRIIERMRGFRVKVLDNSQRIIMDSHDLHEDFNGFPLWMLSPEEGEYDSSRLFEDFYERRSDLLEEIAEMEREMTFTFREGEQYFSMPWNDIDEVRVPLMEGDGVVGYLELSEGPDYFGGLDFARAALILASILAAVPALIAGLLMGRRLTRPLLRLTAAVENYGKGEFSTRVNEEGEDEIGLLSRQFNAMASRLENSFREIKNERDILKNFAADASHELRTPVTALKTFTELLEGKAGEDIKKRQEFLKDSAIQIERIERIIGDLLELTRFDGDLVQLEKEDVSLRELIGECTRTLEHIAGKKGITFDLKTEKPLPALSCDRHLMTRAILNILDNALKFSPDNNAVSISAHKEEDSLVLFFSDEGPGIKEEDLTRIFDRFYRSSESGSAGNGLGLAISKSIIDAHGGSVSAENGKEGGCTIRVSLPQTL